MNVTGELREDDGGREERKVREGGECNIASLLLVPLLCFAQQAISFFFSDMDIGTSERRGDGGGS